MCWNCYGYMACPAWWKPTWLLCNIGLAACSHTWPICKVTAIFMSKEAFYNATPDGNITALPLKRENLFFLKVLKWAHRYMSAVPKCLTWDSVPWAKESICARPGCKPSKTLKVPSVRTTTRIIIPQSSFPSTVRETGREQSRAVSFTFSCFRTEISGFPGRVAEGETSSCSEADSNWREMLGIYSGQKQRMPAC